MNLSTICLAIFLGVFCVSAAAVESAAEEKRSTSPAASSASSKFMSSEDGWLDVSGFLDEAYGFVPIAFPITEPAVGYGAGGGLLFVDRDKTKVDSRPGYGRPNLTAVGGLGTENGTWGVFAGDSRYWFDDRLQTLTGIVYASVNLDFYGIGQDSRLRDHPLRYNLEPLAGLVHAKYRLGDSRVHAGLGYAFATTAVTFDAPAATPGIPDIQNVSRVGGVTLSLTYDSRDNIFTPRSGTYLDVSGGLFSQALGGDSNFQRAGLTAIQFFPLGQDLTLGLNAGAMASFGDVPFYLRPFIVLRGVPAMRYQGDEVSQLEAELRWQCWKRFSIVGFGGSGTAWNDFARVDKRITVSSGGVGFRYEIARSYGLHMGLDVAYGPDGPAIYVQIGSAWIRP